MQFIQRKTHDDIASFTGNRLSPLQRTIIANRGDSIDSLAPRFSREEAVEQIIDSSLRSLPHPKLLKGADEAAARIARAVIDNELVVSVNDFDTDGCTASSVIYGAFVDYFGVPESNIHTVIGNRFTDGYGLSDSIADNILSMDKLPNLVITADCGSSDELRIQRLKAAGIDVIVSDHHAIKESSPPVSAFALVNPTQKGCQFGDATIAGCGVAWLLMSYVRGYLLKLDNERFGDMPKLSGLLDYVALGTVADCVSIASPINRAFIRYGLKLINQASRPCWFVAKQAICRDNESLNETDLGFRIGPRINARSRMSDASVAAAFLRTRSVNDARTYFSLMDNDNEERKSYEAEMKTIAFDQVERKQNPYCSVAFDASFHEGVQGIVSSRLTERFGKPSMVFSPSVSDNSIWKGSARSVGSIPIDKVLELVEKNDLAAEPDTPLFEKWGGHKGAAGCSVNASRVCDFEALFSDAIQQCLTDESLQPEVMVDGSLVKKVPVPSIDTVDDIDALAPFGVKFEAPIFCDTVLIKSARLIGATPVHLKMEVIFINAPAQSYDAIWFNAIDAVGDSTPVAEGEHVTLAYTLSKNHFRGNVTLQLMVNGINKESQDNESSS